MQGRRGPATSRWAHVTTIVDRRPRWRRRHKRCSQCLLLSCALRDQPEDALASSTSGIWQAGASAPQAVGAPLTARQYFAAKSVAAQIRQIPSPVVSNSLKSVCRSRSMRGDAPLPGKHDRRSGGFERGRCTGGDTRGQRLGRDRARCRAVRRTMMLGPAVM